MKMIENKWKRFAIYQTISDWGDIAPDDLFDQILEQDTNEAIKELFDEYEVCVWQPFEDWHFSNLCSHIEELARCAQETAND